MSTNPSSPTASPFDASGLSTASGSGEALRQLVLEVFRLNGALLRHDIPTAVRPLLEPVHFVVLYHFGSPFFC